MTVVGGDPSMESLVMSNAQMPADPFDAFYNASTALLHASNPQVLKPVPERFSGFSDYGRQTTAGLAAMSYDGRRGEFWRFLTERTTDDPEALSVRQAAFMELITLTDDPEKATELEGAFGFARTHLYLQEEVPVYSQYRDEPTYHKRIDLYLAALENTNDNRADAINPDHIASVLDRLVEQQQNSLAASGRFTTSYESGFLSGVVARNHHLVQGLGTMDGQTYLDLARREPVHGGRAIRRGLNQLTANASSLDYVTRLSDGLVRYGWQPIGLAADQPAEIKGAWNLYWDRTKQVTNDHLQNSTMFIVGSNMSGKSIWTTAGFMAHAAGQSFGFIPAQGGNILPKKALMLLEKPDSNPGSGLSSFGAEAEWWGEVLDTIAELTTDGGAPAIWSDEPFSSTDPEEQKLLIEAIVGHIRKIGGSVIMATHADLSGLGPQYQDAFYHLATESGADGLPIFTYKLTEGLADSDALNVARKLGLPERIVARAEALLSGKDFGEFVVPERSFPDLDHEPPVDTDELARQNVGLAMFLGTPPLQWVTRTRLWDEDYSSWQVAEHDEHTQALIGRQGSVFRRTTDHELQMGSNTVLESLIGETATSSPFELKHRQEFFAGLTADPERYEQLQADMQHLLGVVHAFSGDYKGPGEGRIHDRAYSLRRDWPGAILGVISEFISKNNNETDSFDSFQYVLPHRVPRLESVGILLAFLSQAFPDALEHKQHKALATLREMMAQLSAVVADSDVSDLRVPIAIKHRMLMSRFAQDQEQYWHSYAATSWDSQQWRDTEETDFRTLTHQLLGVSQRLTEAFSQHCPKVGLGEFPMEVYGEFADQMRTSVRPNYQYVRRGFSYFVPDALSFLQADKDISADIAAQLRLPGSLYGNQLANYVDQLATDYFDGHTNGRQYFAHIQRLAAGQDHDDDRVQKTTAQKTRHFDHHYSFGGTKKPATVYSELENTRQLLMIGERIIRDGWKPVAFSVGGNTVIEQAGVPTRWRGEHVKQSIAYSPAARVDVLEGPNMSGKTTLLKTQFWAHVLPQAIGFAPVNHAVLPIYDKILYLDRVPAEDTKGLSSFGTEVENWKAALEALEGRGPSFIVLDEPFSSTAEKYQRVLVNALLQDLAASGHTVLVSTHNHRAVDEFTDATKAVEGAVEIHNLETSIDDGEITFLYRRQSGRARSFAVEVIRKLAGPALRSILDEYLAHQATIAND